LVANALHSFSEQPPPLPIFWLSKGKLNMLSALQVLPDKVTKHMHLPVPAHGPLTVHCTLQQQQQQQQQTSEVLPAGVAYIRPCVRYMMMTNFKALSQRWLQMQQQQLW
jgi:hypothetical protein